MNRTFNGPIGASARYKGDLPTINQSVAVKGGANLFLPHLRPKEIGGSRSPGRNLNLNNILQKSVDRVYDNASSQGSERGGNY